LRGGGGLVFALCFALIGFLLIPVLAAALIVGWIVYAILMIIAAVKANDGVRYRYPMTIRFVT